jgi:YHS domain-containing protein
MHQVDPVIGQHVTHTETSATDQYKLQHQVDPVTGKPVVGENTNHNNSNTDGKVEHGAALSPRELEKVNTTYKENVTHLFHNNKDKYAWERVKEKTPEDLLKLEKENVSMYETYKPLTSYIHKLEELTGLRPETKSLLVPIDETNSQFIVRAMQKAQEMGQLDKVKL